MVERYLRDFNPEKIKKIYCDVAIIGSGIAGLYTSLNIASDKSVYIVTKSDINDNNSSLAQGGIAASMGDSKDVYLHIEDTLRAGSHHNNNLAVEIMVSEAKGNIERLVSLGVNFDRDKNGNLLLTREGGHTSKRVLHSKDQTGKEIIRALSSQVLDRNNIRVCDYSYVVDIYTENRSAKGVYVVNERDEYLLVANSIVLATGGIGQIYLNTTNSKVATGDGIAMASRAGAKIVDMEFIQFHPTALYSEDSERKLLISEAVRGEGAILRNTKGEAFMKRYHKLRDLAPRDVVSRAIANEMKRVRVKHLYLDMTKMETEYVKGRFPFIYGECLCRGIDITQEYIPICPVQHYVMGGIETDTFGKTSIDNLYACGEVASVGVHGANRLASNSLLEAVVFGYRVTQIINAKETKYTDMEDRTVMRAVGIGIYSDVVKKLNEIMTEHVSIFRKKSELIKAKKVLKALSIDTNHSQSISYFEIRNMITVAQIITQSAIDRSYSLGSHMVTDSNKNIEEDDNCLIGI